MRERRPVEPKTRDWQNWMWNKALRLIGGKKMNTTLGQHRG